MNRIEKVREVVDSIILNMTDNGERRCAYIHLYGVAQAAALIAEKRKENVELSIIAAMLHDIYSYQNGDSTDHAHKGAVMAKEIINELKIFSFEEIELIYSAIYHHSDKKITNGSFDEILKDADVIQHIFYNPLFEIKAHELERFNNLKNEFRMI
ncbi:MAG: HD domain-containing protein [Clostridiales bacterium]|nr:HD domain-containing protein [Clostridiales bacterium]